MQYILACLIGNYRRTRLHDLADNHEWVKQTTNLLLFGASEPFKLIVALLSIRLKKVVEANLPCIVAVIDETIIGYPYATKWKERSAYCFSVESTIYLSNEFQRKGLGTVLYTSLLNKLKTLGINSVIGGVTLQNPASVGLHEKLGMEKVAHFSKVGFKFDQWLDVGYWQLSLNA